MPSPERLNHIQYTKTPSSIGGDSDYLEAESRNMLKTPSTISNISLVLNTVVDFIASPTVIYEAHKYLDGLEEHNDCVNVLIPTSGFKELPMKNNQLSSKRCLNDLFYSEPSTSYSNDHDCCRLEPTPLSAPNPVDLDETLKGTNISDSILSEKTITGQESITSTPNHQDYTHIGINSDIEDRLSSEHQNPHQNTNEVINNIGLEHQIEDEYQRTESTQKLNTRKQKRNKTKDALNKELKNSGEAYDGSRSKKMYAKKVLKASCNCSKKCGEKITHEQREYIMQKYYELGDHERQWQYIVNHTVAEDVKQISVIRKRTRTQTVKYFFVLNSEKVQVCKTFFINTLSISHQTVYTALEKI